MARARLAKGDGQHVTGIGASHSGYHAPMWSDPSASPFAPTLRALSQLDDPVFLGVLARCVAWSVVCFAALHVGTSMGRASPAGPSGMVGLDGGHSWVGRRHHCWPSGCSCRSRPPSAHCISTGSPSRWSAGYYPWMPPPRGAPMMEQLWDGIAVALRVLVLNIVALMLALLIPGVGLVLGLAHRSLCNRSRPFCCGCDAPDASRGRRVGLCWTVASACC